jgi:hypothetical protein
LCSDEKHPPLDASGKSGAHRHPREIIEPARQESAAGFFAGHHANRKDSFNLSKLFRRFFSNLSTTQKQFDTSGKSPA